MGWRHGGGAPCPSCPACDALTRVGALSCDALTRVGAPSCDALTRVGAPSCDASVQYARCVMPRRCLKWVHHVRTSPHPFPGAGLKPSRGWRLGVEPSSVGLRVGLPPRERRRRLEAPRPVLSRDAPSHLATPARSVAAQHMQRGPTSIRNRPRAQPGSPRARGGPSPAPAPGSRRGGVRQQGRRQARGGRAARAATRRWHQDVQEALARPHHRYTVTVGPRF